MATSAITGSTAYSPLLTLPEAAAYLRVSKRTLERLIQRRQLTTVMIGNSRRVEKAMLDDFIERNRRSARGGG